MPLSDECVFCKIIKGELPCAKVYEDDMVLAFLDIAPFNLGHTVIIPKEHFPSIMVTPPEYSAAMIKVAPLIGAAMMRVTKADAFNLFINNGVAAGQTVPHCHLHVLPRFTEDKVVISSAPLKYDSPAAMAELAAKARARLQP